MNYADQDVPHTRGDELQHYHQSAKRAWPDGGHDRGVPLGPARGRAFSFDTPEDRRRLQLYRDLARAEPDVRFGGRLGSNQYLDMHMRSQRR